MVRLSYANKNTRCLLVDKNQNFGHCHIKEVSSQISDNGFEILFQFKPSASFDANDLEDFVSQEFSNLDYIEFSCSFLIKNFIRFFRNHNAPSKIYLKFITNGKNFSLLGTASIFESNLRFHPLTT